jgi:hypothetical protein
MIEDIISNNIVLLTRWQKRETECSDEPNKESKTSMERGFILFCNIVILIAAINQCLVKKSTFLIYCNSKVVVNFLDSL